MSPEKIIELARDADLVTWLHTSKNFSSGVWWIDAHEPDDCLFKFANLVAQLERERIATSIEKLPFGDTAASFAIYVRELKDE